MDTSAEKSAAAINNQSIVDNKKTAAASTISRFACRIICDRNNTSIARLYAAGFDSSRNIFLGVIKWIIYLHINYFIDQTKYLMSCVFIHKFRKKQQNGKIVKKLMHLLQMEF